MNPWHDVRGLFMKILHLVDTLDPAYGGPAVVAPSLAATQAAYGHEVFILTNTPRYAEADSKAQLALIPGIERVRIQDFHAHRFWQKVFPLRSLIWLARFIDADTVVHLHGVWEPILWFAAWFARWRKAIYVSRPCSMLHPWQMKRYVWQKKIVFFLGASSMLRNASFIHALNTHESEFVKQYVGKAPVYIIPNGYFPETIMSDQDAVDIARKYPGLANKRYILFLGRLHYQKGLMYLLEAFAKLSRSVSDVQLVITGPDGGDQAPAEAYVQENDLADRVLFTGPLYGKEKAGVLSSATCYCLPSLNEGFSNAVLEALAYGLPVVISKECFFPEVKKSGAGKVVDANPDSIADALVDILSNPNVREKMSYQASELIGRYKWQVIARDTLSLYEAARKMVGGQIVSEKD